VAKVVEREEIQRMAQMNEAQKREADRGGQELDFAKRPGVAPDAGQGRQRLVGRALDF